MRLQEFDLEISSTDLATNTSRLTLCLAHRLLDPQVNCYDCIQAEEHATSDAGAGSVRIGYGSATKAEEEEEVTQPWPSQDPDPPVSTAWLVRSVTSQTKISGAHLQRV
ncbi:hypothetical protein ABBQ38_012244 [Trebouxia sp. C0009 RCD-2024]